MAKYKSIVERMNFMSCKNYDINELLPTKNMRTALVLNVIFGPLGMIYSTITGAVIMSILSLITIIFAFGIWIIIVWTIQFIWTAIAVNMYNKRILDKVIYYNRETLKRRAYSL